MTQTSIVIPVIQVILSVGIGLLVRLKLSPLVQKMVVAAMPMQQHMQENFLRRLGLIAGTITIILAMLRAEFVHLSTEPWFKSIEAGILKPNLPPTLQTPSQLKTTDPTKEQEANPATSQEHAQEVGPRPQEISLNPLSKHRNPGFDPRRFYLQLEAFEVIGNA